MERHSQHHPVLYNLRRSVRNCVQVNLRFLMHLNGESRLNLAYYIFKSIDKKFRRVRNHPDHTSHSVFHHGLIKLLITTELEKNNKSWQNFIFFYGFEPETQMHNDDKEIRK